MVRRRFRIGVVVLQVIAAGRATSQASGSGHSMMVHQVTTITPLTGQPTMTQELTTRVRVLDGVVRVDFTSDANPMLRAGTYLLLDARTGVERLVDPAARTVMLTRVDGTRMGPLLGIPLTVRDTASVREDLGAGDTIAGYPTQLYRVTTRYAMRNDGTMSSDIVFRTTATLHVSEAVAALDTGFAAYRSRLLAGTGLPTADDMIKSLAEMAAVLPRGMALRGEAEYRMSLGGREVVSRSEWQVTSLSHGGVTAADVAVPTEYTSTDASAMMRQAIESMKMDPTASPPPRKP